MLKYLIQKFYYKDKFAIIETVKFIGVKDMRSKMENIHRNSINLFKKMWTSQKQLKKENNNAT